MLQTNTYVDYEPSQSNHKCIQFSAFLQAYFIMAESLKPTKAGRASPDTSQVPSTQDTVPEEFLRFYKRFPQVKNNVTTPVFDK